jgi:hypothetical protein
VKSVVQWGLARNGKSLPELPGIPAWEAAA